MEQERRPDVLELLGSMIYTRDRRIETMTQQIETMTQRIADLTALLEARDRERDYVRALEARVQHLNSEVDRLKALE